MAVSTALLVAVMAIISPMRASAAASAVRLPWAMAPPRVTLPPVMLSENTLPLPARFTLPRKVLWTTIELRKAAWMGPDRLPISAEPVWT